MKAVELKKKYVDFFKEKKHAIISSASLIPEHDPTVLFTTAGMHPLVPFLIGQPHPQGKRLANVQKCIRTGDIDEVGDASHLTLFEMLGNWSLGDYFKEDAIKWSFEFITDKKWLGMDVNKLHVTVFVGDKDAPKSQKSKISDDHQNSLRIPRDKESASVWHKLGIPKERIYYLPKKDNWWGPAGATGPCGPDTEMFIDTGEGKCSRECKPGCNCGKYFEIWNDVFMEYNKTEKGFEKLKQQNVDTGMGVERTAAMLQGKKTVYEIETLAPIMDEIKKHTELKVFDENQEISLRIITDHLRASVFILGDENKVAPSNLDQGYILRRFIRRSIRHAKLIGIDKDFCSDIAKVIIKIYGKEWPEIKKNGKFIIDELKKEEDRFRLTLEKGLRQFEKISAKGNLSAKDAFFLFQSYGFPIEMIKELAAEKKLKVDEKGFHKEFEKHQELSRKGAEKRFKGGLSDSSVETTKLHTATHLLNEALREVLKDKEIVQKGSNITPERLRFDFNFPRKLTPEEIKKVEDLVNKEIKKGIAVKREEMTVEQAKQKGAQAMFDAKYGQKVSVYSVGGFSIEICMGPHVKNTKELGKFKIKKEESVAAGVRRIKAVLE